MSFLKLFAATVLTFVRWLGRPIEELLDPFGDDEADQW